MLLDKNEEDFITPCQVVLLQELERWNNLVKKMAISLQDLNKALVGEIGMSDELDNLGDSLYNGFSCHSCGVDWLQLRRNLSGHG